MTNPTPSLNFREFFGWITKLRIMSSDSTSHSAKVLCFLSGSEALASICWLEAVKLGRPVNVAIPAYFCGQSLNYLRSINANLIFYELGNDFKPDMISLSQIEKSIDVIIQVHYFGMKIDYDAISALKQETRPVLVHDCSHMLSTSIFAEVDGDYFIFSPHKHFPLPKIGLVMATRVTQFPYKNQQFFPLWWIIRQLLKNLRVTKPKPVWKRTWSGHCDKLSFSKSSSLLISLAFSYLKTANDTLDDRRKIVTEVTNLIQTVGGWTVESFQQCDKTNYLICVACDTAEIAHRRYDLLNKNGKIVMQWPDLPNELHEYPKLCSKTAEFHDKRIFFFVNPQHDVCDILEKLKLVIQHESF